jgi:hypothetical protein
VEAPLPVVIASAAHQPLTRYASTTALLQAEETDILCLDLAQMGVSRQWLRQLDACLAAGPLRRPARRLEPLSTPDSSLPAFDRIQKLLAGAMAKREGRVVGGADEQVVEEMFQMLLREGWLSHLNAENP